MLVAFFRGAFLIGILAWYSLSVWKMIDGYFRDQFASYLHEEYRKNPRMKSDVRDVNAMNKNDPVFTDEESVLDKMVELEAEGYSGDNTDVDKKVESLVVIKNEEIKEPKNKIENKIQIKENLKNEKVKNEEKIEGKKKMVPLKKKEEAPKRGRKRRVKTITLKEEDFMSVKKRRDAIERDEDFWEFEEDEEEGIPISELPYKPKLNIGRLERITPDEYCPLTLEDELSCGETTKWP
ncbi:hypothetical protein KPH14_012074 [Odynerus spinipes]|uniref:Uncharacterized protein n=1 Tax=Odynerus spinipes TaxID=1348599 RepID=A0AAD9R9H8_9HYME|nr:hypothetical protein KPH14_012074 [Odynerus spinipes]